MKRMGTRNDWHILSVFFKALSFRKRGRELPGVRREIAEIVLRKIKNRDDLVKTILLTPKDLSELFSFPRGNIDHAEIAPGQTFFDRNYSARPGSAFYQFGRHQNVFYCGAASYPCGSIAGTPGYVRAPDAAWRAISLSDEPSMVGFGRR